MTVQDAIELPELEQAHLSRYQVEKNLTCYASQRAAADISLVEAEISEEQKKIEFLRDRLARLNEEKSSAEIRTEQVNRILSGVKRRVLEHAGIQDPDPDAYDLQTSPNGSVMALAPKGE